MSIGCASRLPLRSRLTLIRLALIRNPWSSGEGVSRPLCRYLYLHLLFRCVQRVSRHAFARSGMLPYRYKSIPRLRHRAYARLFSTRGRSTSELLRTLQMNGCFQANILAVSAAPPRYCLQLSPDFGALGGGLSCSSLGRGPYHPRPHSRESSCGIRSSSGLDRRRSPRTLSVALPPQDCPEAAPKCISGSTSYLQV